MRLRYLFVMLAGYWPDARWLADSAPSIKTAGGVGVVDTTSVRGKVMCGYQGWFRCPGDAANLGWIHWSRDTRQIALDLLTFEMWPDMTDYSPAERYPAPGFTYPGGRQAELFSSDDPRTVLRHFEWMRDYGIDGAWLQHFLVDLPGGPGAVRYPTRLRVMNHVRAAARQTGRVWALSYDIAGMSLERIFDVLTADWKNMVDQKVVEDPRYLHQGGRPVVQIWGFYAGNAHDPMTVDLGAPDRFLPGPRPVQRFPGRRRGLGLAAQPRPSLAQVLRAVRRLLPWNIGNYTIDEAGLSTPPRRTGWKISASASGSGCFGIRSSIPASVGIT